MEAAILVVIAYLYINTMLLYAVYADELSVDVTTMLLFWACACYS
jgi:hypothetical protein